MSATVLAEVATERAAQDAKWGEQNHPNGTGAHEMPLHEIVRGAGSATGDQHYAFGLALMAKSACDRRAKAGSVTWRDIFLEEVFESMAESDPALLRAEVVQVIAVGVAWVEAIDRAEATS